MYIFGLREILNIIYCFWVGFKFELFNLEVSKVILRLLYCVSTGEDKFYFEKWCILVDFIFKSKIYFR